MPKEKPTGNNKTAKTNSSWSRSTRQISREPPADRPYPGRSPQRVTYFPSDSEGTLESNSSPSEYYRLCKTSPLTDSGIASMSKGSETDKLVKILAAVMERSEADRARDEERRARDEEERERREEEKSRREERRAKETREMILALREAQLVVPQTVHIDNTKLPTMSEGEDVEVFLDLFESAMVDNHIPEDKWRGKMHASLDTATKLKVRDLIRNPDVTYQEVKDALIGC